MVTIFNYKAKNAEIEKEGKVVASSAGRAVLAVLNSFQTQGHTNPVKLDVWKA